MAGSDAKDKRQTIRIQPFVTPCKVIDGETRYVGYLTDLSTRGARVSCDSPLPAGAQAPVHPVKADCPSAKAKPTCMPCWT